MQYNPIQQNTLEEEWQQRIALVIDRPDYDCMGSLALTVFPGKDELPMVHLEMLGSGGCLCGLPMYLHGL